jgi:peptidoglycan/xylan/chitin deacetylase (PgdA/CDA1 family)
VSELEPNGGRGSAGGVELGVTVLAGRSAWAWTTALEQDGWTHRTAPQPQSPIAVTTGTVGSGLRSWVERGGILVVDEAAGGDGVVPASDRTATVTGFEDPGWHTWVAAPGLVHLHEGSGGGELRVHEDRVVKHGLAQGRYPVALYRRFGRGHVVWTGMPLTALLAAHGDRLRPVAVWSEVTERASTVDKAGVAETLVWMVHQAAQHAGLPIVRRAAWPDGAPSVFVLRVDVDGVFGDRARRLGEVAEAHGVRATFLLNRELVDRHPGDLGSWLDAHDVGQHADLHDLHDVLADDRRNVAAGEAWVRELTGRSPVGFVAPRGLWSPSLDRALAELGYRWSSDFGLATDLRPFRPTGPVLQVPVHAYSPERAVLWSQEQGRPAPAADDIRQHYLRHLEEQVRRKRPVHLYGHPEVLGEVAAAVLPPVIRRAEQAGLPKLTLEQAASWWEQREEAELIASWSGGPQEPELHIQRSDSSIYLEIDLPTPARVVLDGVDLGRERGELRLGPGR